MLKLAMQLKVSSALIQLDHLIGRLNLSTCIVHVILINKFKFKLQKSIHSCRLFLKAGQIDAI